MIKIAKKINLAVLILFSGVPFVVLAFSGSSGGLQDLISSFINLLNFYLLPLAWAVMFLVFLWGLVKLIFHLGNEDSLEDGKRLMVWGVIGIFVVTSVFAIGYFIKDALNLSDVLEIRTGTSK